MIVFENPGVIDVRAITTFGVSVKDGENPIGFFGTGLKYAIAVLLRTGHKVEISAGLQVHRFDLTVDTIRGQEFKVITIATDGDEPRSLGFTTDLGKQWELWMAYRELACNCKDEAGTVRFASATPAPVVDQTTVTVIGDAFEGIYEMRHLYILVDEPAQTIDSTEVRNRPGQGLFYRGVKVMELPKPALYTYNLNAKLELTEDRTVKSGWQVGCRIAQAVLHSKDREFIRNIISAEQHSFESDLDFHGWSTVPSDEFIQVVGNCMQDRRLAVNLSAMKVWKDATRQQFVPRELALTAVQLMALNRALDFCDGIGFPIRGSYPIKVVEALGGGGLGLAEDQTIYIAERTFHLGGSKQLASTLIEEYVHLKFGYKDMTRELQSFLFEKLVSMGEELAGAPL